MATLLMKDIPDDLYTNLLAMAKQGNYSISQETIVLLRSVLEMKEKKISRRKALLAAIDQFEITKDTDSFPAPADLIREDRNR